MKPFQISDVRSPVRLQSGPALAVIPALPVIPAQAGIQGTRSNRHRRAFLEGPLRGNDGVRRFRVPLAGFWILTMAILLLPAIADAVNINGSGVSLDLLSSDYWSADAQHDGANASLLSAGTPDVGTVSENGQGAKLIIDPLNALSGSTGPSADFSADPVTGSAPLEVHFTDDSSGGLYEITEWSWTFGDTATSTEQNPVHTYQTPGVYSVTLTISASGNTFSTTKTDFITVSQAVPVGGGAVLTLTLALAGAFMLAARGLLRRKPKP